MPETETSTPEESKIIRLIRYLRSLLPRIPLVDHEGYEIDEKTRIRTGRRFSDGR